MAPTRIKSPPLEKAAPKSTSLGMKPIYCKFNTPLFRSLSVTGNGSTKGS
jgi:hypothetical protein